MVPMPCCMSSRTLKPWLRWLWKAEVPQWGMCQEHTELLLIGYSIESTWTQKSKSSTLIPINNLLTYWPREISHEANGAIFQLCFRRQEFQLDKLAKNDGEEDAGTEGRRKNCGKIDIYEVFRSSTPTEQHQRSSTGELVAWCSIKQAHPQLNQGSNAARQFWFEQCWLCGRTRSFLDLVRCCTSWRITKQWLEWTSRAGVQQWDIFPEPTELLLIGFFDWINFGRHDPNQVHWHQTPDCWHNDQWEFHTRWVESAFLAQFAALRYSARPAAPERWRKEFKNRKETTGSWQSQSLRRWTWSSLSRQVLRLWTVRLRRKAWGCSEHLVEQIGQVLGNLTQETAITTQRRALKDGKKMHFWTYVQGSVAF